MNDLNIGVAAGTIVLLWNRINAILRQYAKIVEPIIVAAEDLAKDGVIDRGDRKKIVLGLLKKLEDEKKIKLNFVSRRIVHLLIDQIARTLPDFKVSTAMIATVKKYREKIANANAN